MSTFSSSSSSSSSPSVSSLLPLICGGSRKDTSIQSCLFVSPKQKNITFERNKEEFSSKDKDEDKKDGSIENPFLSLHDAIDAPSQYSSSSSSSSTNKTMIVLRGGIHELGARGTIHLGHAHSGLHFMGYPGEDVWISGGISLRGGKDLWKPWHKRHNHTILVANLTTLLQEHATPLPTVAAVFTTYPKHNRLIRARYPNANPERDQWGYASTKRNHYSIPTASNIVLEWNTHPPNPKNVPNFTFVNFTDVAHLPQDVPMKNDSTMAEYNTYVSVAGGVCADIWGVDVESYWCSNASAGGWAEVDHACVMNGAIEIPIGLTYNRSHDVGHRIDGWIGENGREEQESWNWIDANNGTNGCDNGRINGNQNNSKFCASNAAIGGLVHAWHSQTWSMHMFEIESAKPGHLTFKMGGGKQGARKL